MNDLVIMPKHHQQQHSAAANVDFPIALRMNSPVNLCVSDYYLLLNIFYLFNKLMCATV